MTEHGGHLKFTITEFRIELKKIRFASFGLGIPADRRCPIEVKNHWEKKGNLKKPKEAKLKIVQGKQAEVKLQLTKILCKSRAGQCNINNVLLSAVVRADIYKFGFLLLTSTLYFQLGSGSGLDVIKYPTCSNTCPLCAICRPRWIKLLSYSHSGST